MEMDEIRIRETNLFISKGLEKLREGRFPLIKIEDIIDFFTDFQKAYMIMNEGYSAELDGAQQMYDFIRKEKGAKTYRDALDVIRNSGIDERIVHMWIQNKYIIHLPFEKEAFEQGYPIFKDEIMPPPGVILSTTKV